MQSQALDQYLKKMVLIMNSKRNCIFCVFRSYIGDHGSIKCMHPSVTTILETLYEHEPGLALATALNRIGKALNLQVDVEAYKNPRFNFPFYFPPSAITYCSGFTKIPKSPKR